MLHTTLRTAPASRLFTQPEQMKNDVRTTDIGCGRYPTRGRTNSAPQHFMDFWTQQQNYPTPRQLGNYSSSGSMKQTSVPSKHSRHIKTNYNFKLKWIFDEMQSKYSLTPYYADLTL
jgi:hypothetical protein